MYIKIFSFILVRVFDEYGELKLEFKEWFLVSLVNVLVIIFRNKGRELENFVFYFVDIILIFFKRR